MNDILILGGGLIGLAIAVELRMRGASVTVISRDFQEAAAHAAAGMLAPQAEQIPPGALLELCLRSRQLYSEWIQKLEAVTGRSTGYWPCGILAPVYDLDAKLTPVQTPATPVEWLDRSQLGGLQPGLSPEVVGAWWFPKDGQVDNRALAHVLWTATQDLGVELQEGIKVEQIEYAGDRVTGVLTSTGRVQAAHYILATGAWSQSLIPVPVTPRKGQMLSIRVPSSMEVLPLQKVLFGNIYLVPRRNGQIVVGATSENVGFTPHNTPAGIHSLLGRAIRLFPGLQEFALEECWWGFRPTTPDELPILGGSAYENLTLAVGHYRNGVLLAPITAQLLAEQLLAQVNDPLLPSFHYTRFAKT